MTSHIGRDREIAIIRDAMLEWNSKHSVLIQGEGGIGKTRLLTEAKAAAELMARGRSDIRIALVQELTESEWSHQFITGAESMAVSLGVNLIASDAHFDLSQMAADLDSAISAEPAAIIVSLGTGEMLRAGIVRAVESKIPVLTFDNNLHGLPTQVIRVSQDDIGGARLSLMQMAEDLRYQGDIVAVWARGHAEQERRRSVLNIVLQQYHDIHLVEEYGAMGPNASDEAYYETMKRIRDRPGISAVWTVFDEYARGVTRALRDLSRLDVKVYSFDLCPSDIPLMAAPDSPWITTVAINPFEAGSAIVRLATMAAYGEHSSLKRHYLLPMVLVTQSDVRTDEENYSGGWGVIDTGWTARLQAIEASRKASSRSIYQLSDIIDFDDDGLRVGENLEIRLAMQLSDSRATFWTALGNLRRAEGGDGPAELRGKYVADLQEALIHDYNLEALHRRTILFFDTVEKADLKTATKLVSLISRLQNTVCLLSGRPAKSGYVEGEDAKSVDIRSILERSSVGRSDNLMLQPFDVDTSRIYLDEKQKQIGLVLDPQVAEVLVALSNGRPILLDLAVEYVAREISIDLLTSVSLDQFAASSDLERQQLIEEFRDGLVQHIAQIRSPMDQLTLLLSRIYPLSTDMIAQLLKISDTVATSLFSEARTYVFIKVVSNEQSITLHDEMRRMIEKYVWELVDEDGERRMRDSRAASILYANIEAGLRNDLAELDARRRTGSSALSDRELYRSEELREALATATEKGVYHALYGYRDDGLNKAFRVIDTARGEGEFKLAQRLLSLVYPYRDALAVEDLAWFDFRAVRASVDLDENLVEATVKLSAILNSPGSDVLRGRCHNLMAKTRTKLGQWEEALIHQKECRSLLSGSDLMNIASAENFLGYIYRLLEDYHADNLALAQQHYSAALDAIREIQSTPTGTSEIDADEVDPALVASIMNNLGYLQGLRQDYAAAFQFCADAIRLWDRIGRSREVARGETSMGILDRDRGHYEQSVRHLTRAIGRLRLPEDGEQLCRAHFHLGWTQLFIAVPGFETTVVDREALCQSVEVLRCALDIAKAHSVLSELPGVYHWLSVAYWRWGRLDDDAEKCAIARDYNQQCRAISFRRNAADKPSNVHYAIESLLADAEFSLDVGEFNAIREDDLILREQFEPFNYDFPLCFGRMRRILGDVALEEEDLELALGLYSDAFLMINAHGGYGPYSIQSELAGFQRRLQLLTDRGIQLRGWLTRLRDLWIGKSGVKKGVDLVLWANQQLFLSQIHGK